MCVRPKTLFADQIQTFEDHPAGEIEQDVLSAPHSYLRPHSHPKSNHCATGIAVVSPAHNIIGQNLIEELQSPVENMHMPKTA